jgi:hypothetical protein
MTKVEGRKPHENCSAEVRKGLFQIEGNPKHCLVHITEYNPKG